MYRTGQAEQLEEVYNLEDALMTAIQMNAFIRHAGMVRMANLAQVVNVIAPVLTRPDGLVLQTIFYPFEMYSRNCGDRALDVFWEGETFSGGSYSGVRLLDVAASLSSQKRQISLFVVNRSNEQTVEAEISLSAGSFASGASAAKAWVVNGKDIKSTNTFDAPGEVKTREVSLARQSPSWVCTFEPHSVTCLVVDIKT
jgi:alpha-N-arabinofuranosidase